jgi:hypothetical protein
MAKQMDYNYVISSEFCELDEKRKAKEDLTEPIKEIIVVKK